MRIDVCLLVWQTERTYVKPFFLGCENDQIIPPDQSGREGWVRFLLIKTILFFLLMWYLS